MPIQENYLHQMLESLRTRLLTMGAKTQQALDKACYALVHRDADMARKVIEGDSEIDAMENEIDENSLAILARTQPVARDLRFVISAVRMVLDIERIGDEAVLIAKRALCLRDLPPSAVIGDLESYGNRSSALLRNALQAFQEGSISQAMEVSHSDAATGVLTEEVTRIIMDNVVEGTVDPHIGMHALLVVRALDRVCRRTQNIAEHTYFMVQGENIKHRPHPEVRDVC